MTISESLVLKVFQDDTTAKLYTINETRGGRVNRAFTTKTVVMISADINWIKMYTKGIKYEFQQFLSDCGD